MADVNANINIDINSSGALAQLRQLQSRITSFNQSVISSNAAAVAAQQQMVSTLQSQIGATQQFTTSIQKTETGVSRLQKAIDTNKLSLGQYFKYGVASSQTFGRVFKKEHSEVFDLASDRVKRLQTQYIGLETAQNGVMKTMAVRPLNLFNADAEIGIQKQQLFNKLLHDGSTSLVNFGKNTQWAGRQLMVGFTVPLTIFGGLAGKIFMDLEQQVVKFRRVYGDATTPQEETNKMIAQIQTLGKEYTKYGIAVKDTVALAADAAAAGAQGEELVAATSQATRLATLGMIDQQQALTATIALQNAFKLSTDELAQSVDFLNAVENQTVVSLDDVTQAIPKVAPVIKGLGGDVQDLAIFLAAMREGGVNAAEGANALKSGLASLINPTDSAQAKLEKLGIDLKGILSTNKGDLRAIVMEFGAALGTLDKFQRQQLLADMFGKYQFARLGALFDNINKKGSQAQRVLELTGQSAGQMANLAEKELSAIEQSVGVRFIAAIEKLKLAIAPIGETFLKIATPIVEAVGGILEKFNELSPGVKQFITILVGGLGVVVPTVIMLIGLFANFAGNAIKGISLIRGFMTRLKGGGSVLQYYSGMELDAAAAAASLEGATNSLTGALRINQDAVNDVAGAYVRFVESANAAAANLPTGFRTPRLVGGTTPGGKAPKKMAVGGFVGGKGNKDSEPALLMPGEFVVNKDAATKYGPVLSAMNNGTISGYAGGTPSRGAKRSFDVGGTAIDLSVWDTKTITAIERRIAAAAEIGESAVAELATILQGMVDEVSITAAKVDREIRQSATAGSGLKQIAAEKDYSAPEWIQKQTDKIGTWSTKQDEINAVQERVGRLWNVNEGQMENLVKTQASHKTVLDASGARMEKTFNDVSNLTPDLGAVNNYLNRVKDMTFDTSKNSAIIQRIMQQTGMSYEDVLREVNNLKNEIHPQTQKAFHVLNSLSQIDEEYSLIAMETAKQRGLSQNQTEKMRNELGVRAVSGYQASGAVAATGARLRDTSFVDTQVERVYTDTRRVASAVPKAVADEFQVASPSEVGAQIGEEVPRGVAEGIRRTTPQAVDAANDLATKVNAELDSGLKKRRGATRGQGAPGAVPIIRLDADAEEKPRRKGRRSASRPQGSPSTIGGQEVVPKSAKTLPMVAPDPKVAEKELGKFKKSMQFAGEKAKTFGKSLVRGSGKLQGALFGLDSLVIGLSFLDNNIGEMAQKIMPAVFAIQGLTMVLPMLMNPVGLAIAAVGAMAAAAIMFKMKSDEMSANAQKMSDSLISASDTVNKIGEFYGKKSIAETIASKQAEKQYGVGAKQLTKAQEFVATDTGVAMKEGLSLAIQQMGETNAAKQFANNLASMVLQGVLSPNQAKAIAATMGQELGNKTFSMQAEATITQLMGPKNENLLKDPLKLNIEIDKQNQRSVSLLTEDMTDLSNTLAHTSDVTLPKLGMVWGMSLLNPISAATTALGFFGNNWNNVLGDVSRGMNAFGGSEAAQGYKTLVTNLEAMGGLIGNNLKQSYDNLTSAKERYNQISKEAEKIDKKDVEAKAEAEAASRRAKMQQDLLTESINKQKDAMVANFKAIQNDQGKDRVLAGMQVSIQDLYKDNPALKASYDMISGSIAAIGQQDIKFRINMELASGQLSPLTMQSVLGLYQNPEMAATKVLNIVANVNGNTPLANSFIQATMGAQLGDFYSTYVLEVVSRGMSEEQIKQYTGLLNEVSLIQDPELRKEIAISARGMKPDQIKDYKNTIKAVQSFPKKISKEINVNTVGAKGLKNISSAYDEFASKKPRVVKRALVDMGKTPANIAQMLDTIGMSLEEFANAPSSFKFAVAAAMSLDIKESGPMSADAAERLATNTRNRLLSLVSGSQRQFGVGGNGQGDGTDGGTDGAGGGGGGGGGGDKKTSASKQLIKDLLTQIKMTREVGKGIKGLTGEQLRFKGWAQKLRDAGMPESIVADWASKGKEGIKLASKALKDYNKETGKFEKDSFGARVKRLSVAAKVGQIVEDQRQQAKKKQYERTAKQRLDALGAEISPAQREIALADEATVEMLATLDVSSKQWRRIINAIKSATTEIENQISALEKENTLASEQLDIYNHDMQVLQEQETKIRDAYQKRISALEEVAKVNDYIIGQQKSQIGLADALSKGDISAAAVTAQEMRGSSAQFAMEQQRTGLETGLDNLINSITVNGQTKDQIQANIDKINEETFYRNQLILTLQKQAEAGTASSAQSAGAPGGSTAAAPIVTKRFDALYGNLKGKDSRVIQNQVFGGTEQDQWSSIWDDLNKKQKKKINNLMEGGLTNKEAIKIKNMKLAEAVPGQGSTRALTEPKYDTTAVAPSISADTAAATKSGSVYNNSYDVHVNVSGSNASPDAIADKVISKIKNMNNAGIRGHRGNR